LLSIVSAVGLGVAAAAAEGSMPTASARRDKCRTHSKLEKTSYLKHIHCSPSYHTQVFRPHSRIVTEPHWLRVPGVHSHSMRTEANHMPGQACKKHQTTPHSFCATLCQVRNKHSLDGPYLAINLTHSPRPPSPPDAHPKPPSD
jgi:hypothetical protein